MLRDVSSEDLVRNIKIGKSVNESLIELDSRFCGIFYRILGNYSSTLIKLIGLHAVKDCENERLIILRNSAASYRPKSKFSTWFYLKTNFFFKDVIKKKNKEKTKEIEIKDFIENESLPDSKNFEDKLSEIFEMLENYQDPRAKIIFKERYCSSKKITSYRNVAKSFGGSVSYEKIREIHDDALAFIKSSANKLSMP